MLLRSFKSGLPFLFRYQTAGGLAGGHPDYNELEIEVPNPGMSATNLLAFITGHLGGWQSTRFPSHLILYKEHREYGHGTVVARG